MAMKIGLRATQGSQPSKRPVPRWARKPINCHFCRASCLDEVPHDRSMEYLVHCFVIGSPDPHYHSRVSPQV